MRIAALALLGAAGLLIAYTTQAQFDVSGLEPIPRDQLPGIGTFYFAKSPTGRPYPPLPCPPNDPSLEIYALSQDHYVIDNSSVVYPQLEQEQTGSMTWNVAFQDALPVPRESEEPGDSPQPPPNLPNYQKFMGQGFSLIDTNDAAANDASLYNACISFPEDTNTVPTLQIARYGTNAVLIKANRFDYSAEIGDFALVICDRVDTPLYKNVDLSALDIQDGWLVQGSVPSWKVTDPMYLAVTNLALAYNAFFRAIPYSGPQIQLTGLEPYETVSNIITFRAEITDLSGVTNEQVEVTVDGVPARYTLGPSNTISLDTRYNPAGYVTVYVSAFNNARVYDPANPPDNSRLTFSSTVSLPLYFENETYLAFPSDLCPTNVGTNYILFVVTEPQEIEAAISDPSTGQTIASYSGYVPYPATVALPWDFTQADGVTPYSNDTYTVTFTGAGAVTLATTNRIDRQGVREGAGCFLTYQAEDPSLPLGQFLNYEAETWIKGALQTLYSDLYWGWSLTQYTPLIVGSGRDWVSCQPRDQWSIDWQHILQPAFDSTLYSDLTLCPAHGNGSQIGHTPFLPGGFVPATLKVWCQGTFTNVGPNWRLRKAALWTCYSGELGLATNAYYLTTWPDACGIRPTPLQETSYMRKNCGLFFGSELPMGGMGSPASSAAKAGQTLDLIWVCGQNIFPGGCDPTYSFRFAVNATRGMYTPQLDWAAPRLFGYRYMIYSSIYDNELQMLNITHVKGQ